MKASGLGESEVSSRHELVSIQSAAGDISSVAHPLAMLFDSLKLVDDASAY